MEVYGQGQFLPVNYGWPPEQSASCQAKVEFAKIRAADSSGASISAGWDVACGGKAVTVTTAGSFGRS